MTLSRGELVGSVLSGRYRIVRLIGDGGMGRVYEAQHVTLARKIAVKVLKDQLARDEANVERFLQEARAASMISHPNVVDIIDVGRIPDGSVFFVMEFLEGEDLQAVLQREYRLPWQRVQGIALQVVRGLRAAHENHVIHRDMKPANLFLVRTDDVEQVKLLDFGIAKVLAAEHASAITGEGSVFGTARYMSPEQSAGKPVDARSDVYAVGVLLYEMLVGRPPFDSDNFMRVATQHINEPITPPRQAAPDAGISAVVESLIMRALEKDPARRYSTMGEFEAAVLGASFDEGTVAIKNPLTAADLLDQTVIYDLQRAQRRGGSEPPRQSRGGSFGVVDVDRTLVRDSPLRRGAADVAGAQPPPSVPPLPATSLAVARPGERNFFAASASVNANTGQHAAPVLPVGMDRPSPQAAAQQVAAQQTLPPVNWQPVNPTTFENTTSRSEAADTAEFGLHLPRREVSRNWLVIVTAIVALMLVWGGVTAYFLFFDAEAEVSPELHPTVVADEPRAVVVPAPVVAPPPEPAPRVAAVVEEPPAPRPRPPKVERRPRPKREAAPRAPRRPRAVDALGAKELNSGFGKARRSIAACGQRHGAMTGSSFKATFDVAGGRASNVSIQRPHNMTPLGKCVAGAIRSSARFPKSRQPSPGVKRTVRF